MVELNSSTDEERDFGQKRGREASVIHADTLAAQAGNAKEEWRARRQRHFPLFVTQR
jgi:hypothetical protein